MANLPAETKVYVGNLGTGAGKGELERAFSYYGPLRTVWIARNPPGFAFVEPASLPAETKVYVGNLGTGAGKGELERAFSYYGPLRTVWIARNPPGFAFVEFEDPRDAEDAVLGLDGKIICGSRVRVEVSTGMPRRSRYDRPPARRPFDPNDRCYECGEKGHYAYDCHRYSRRRRS
ncbi:PREDICTED: serine/arginine-rich splicing factor 7-like, partial [Phaethon lepturus]|uniref:serine/arginine-rich splicing factor 7-like n=1 Tax=Phaethon lepturus TaxID=97097 RepID=UPI000530BA2D